MPVSITYDELTEALARIGRGDDAAEYHGALCGALCVSKPDDIDLMRLIEHGEQVPNDADARRAFATLRDETVEALQDSEMAFALLLPDDDDVALVPRVRALVAWCGGFLYGFASRPGLDLTKLSEDAREIVRDLTEFTQAAVGDEDPDIEESAYTELVEYVRVGAQLLYMELHPRPTLDPAGSQHIH